MIVMQTCFSKLNRILSMSINHNTAIPLSPLAPIHSEPPAYAGWRTYPVSVHSFNPLTTPAQTYCDRLHKLSSTLFSDAIKLYIIDIDSSGGEFAY